MPQEFTASSNQKTWWDYPCGHTSKTAVHNRAAGKGCGESKCLGFKTEVMFLETLSDVLGLHGDNILQKKNVELDGLARSVAQVDGVGIYKGHPIAFEYDGSRWHNMAGSRARDTDKTRALLDAGYIVIRVREQTRSITLDNLEIFNNNFIQLSYVYPSSNHQEKVSSMCERIKNTLNYLIYEKMQNS